MRTFFAIAPDAACQRRLDQWRTRALPPLGRSVPAANFHVTLAFIGELDAARMDRLCVAVDAWVARERPPAGSLLLDQVGYWPRPGVYWLGARDCPERLARLARRMRQFAGMVGGRAEKKSFLPHITLFRRVEQPPPAPVDPLTLRVDYDHFGLYESRQGRHGVTYDLLTEWPLARER
jgi:2'-5' RNA ligase